MRTAKAKTNVPKRYYRPELKHCPYCQWKLKRGSKLWHKYLITLIGRFYVNSYSVEVEIRSGISSIYALKLRKYLSKMFSGSLNRPAAGPVGGT